MRASHIWRFFLVSCLASGSLAGSNAIVATVRLLSLNGRVAEFEVTLSNPGQPSLYLEESLKGSRDLHAVDIEIEDTSHKWVRVGPKRDAAASGVFELGSGQSVSRKVSVYGLTNRQLSLLKDPHPRYRATLPGAPRIAFIRGVSDFSFCFHSRIKSVSPRPTPSNPSTSANPVRMPTQ
jgi:hypothetical protein